MNDQQADNDGPSTGPRKPPQMSPVFVIVWVLGILTLIVLAGCTVILTFVAFEGTDGFDVATPVGVLVMLAALFGYGRSLRQARRAERSQQPPSTLFLYTLFIPVVTAFVWAGGCLLSLQ